MSVRDEHRARDVAKALQGSIVLQRDVLAIPTNPYLAIGPADAKLPAGTMILLRTLAPANDGASIWALTERHGWQTYWIPDWQTLKSVLDLR